MTISLAADHGGFELKDKIAAYLKARGHAIIDTGVFSAESCDYPDRAKAGCEKVIGGEADLVLLFCGTGIGISIAANKIAGIRCALCCRPETAALARRHNDANALAFGGRFMGEGDAIQIIEAFFAAAFEGGRHLKRVEKISELEKR